MESEVSKATELKRKKERGREGETEWNPGTRGNGLLLTIEWFKQAPLRKLLLDNRDIIGWPKKVHLGFSVRPGERFVSAYTIFFLS